MQPIPTSIAEYCPLLEGIECVCFDLYGTLFQSSAGELPSPDETQSNPFDLSKVLHEPISFRLEEKKHELIAREHSRLRELGHPIPEVDIISIWQQLLAPLHVPRSRAQIAQIIRAYEASVHPTAAMPHALETIHAIRSKKILLGIISNAQFYTHDLFPRHLGKSPHQLGFSTEVYSYQLLRAKPDPFLFEEFLDQCQLPAHKVLYVGNDMCNDIAPAHSLGMRTCLFAGDARSLRLREELSLNAQPDAIIKDLTRLLDLTGHS